MKAFLFLLLLTLALFTGSAVCVPAQTQARPSASQVQADLDRILSQNEFRPEGQQEKNALTQAMERIRKQVDKFWEFVRKMFSVTGGAGGGAGLQWLFMGGFVLLGGGIVFTLLRNLAAGRGLSQVEKRTVFALNEGTAGPLRTSDEWLKEAAQFAQAEDFRQAFRAVFMATLMRLDAADIVTYDSARTNGSYLRYLRGEKRRPLYNLLRDRIYRFDLHWYGNLPATETDYNAALDADTATARLLNALAASGNSASVPAVKGAA